MTKSFMSFFTYVPKQDMSQKKDSDHFYGSLFCTVLFGGMTCRPHDFLFRVLWVQSNLSA